MSKSANEKYKMLYFWEKHGIQATMDAFGIKKTSALSLESKT